MCLSRGYCCHRSISLTGKRRWIHTTGWQDKYLRRVLLFNFPVSLWPTGGSISNMYAFLAARHKMFPGYKEQGLHSIKGQLVMYTSNQVRFLFNGIHSVYKRIRTVFEIFIIFMLWFIAGDRSVGKSFGRWQNRRVRLRWRDASVSRRPRQFSGVRQIKRED